MTTPAFPELLSAIGDRSAALRTAATAVPLTAPVPGCPGWSVRDLLAHLGEVQRFWAAVVTAGPGRTPPEDGDVPGRKPSGDLLAWSADSTGALLAALDGAGPGRGCWTWWAESGAPQTSGAIARHQVQEAAVHARDAQQAAGAAEPLPAGLAADAVDEFLHVSMGSAGPWPHPPARLAFQAAEGPAWRMDLRETGAALAPPGGPAPQATVRGSASDLILFLYSRDTDAAVQVGGDQELVRTLLSWLPTD